MRALPFRTLVPLLALGAAARADVLTVGGQNPDHATIQAAVDAASDGDVVLVAPGGYGPFAITDKSLTVAARGPGTTAVSGMVRVQELAAHRRVALLGLVVTGNGEHALRLAGCEGSVRVAGGAYHGTDAAGPWHSPQNDGAHVSDCGDVAFSGVALTGGDGIHSSLSGFGPASGGHGLLASGSRVALHDCALEGGDGGSDFDEGYDGGNGGSGAWLYGGYLLASGSAFSGGQGGSGGEESGCVPLGNYAGDGGEGGHGVALFDGSFQGHGPAHGELIAFTAFPGPGGGGGLGYCGPNGSPGAAGVPVALTGQSSVSQHPWTARSIAAPGPWRAGQTATLTFRGEPDDLVVLLRSPKTAFVPDPPRKGVLLLGGVPQILRVGTIGPGGVLTRSWTLPPATPGFEGATAHFQAWMVSPASGVHLTGAAPVVVLDPSY